MNKHNTISQENLKGYYKSGRLPHLFDVDKPIFITFRLKFTIPRAVLFELKSRKSHWAEMQDKLSETEKLENSKRKEGLFFAWFDQLIDNNPNVPNFLHRNEITKIIENALKFHDGKRYQLLAYSIMPNHVHVLIYPIKDISGKIFSPAKIAYSWKRFSANQINKALGRKGSLWQKENFDRMVRDEVELGRIINYILQNPVKAGLVSDWNQWQGSYICEDLLK